MAAGVAADFQAFEVPEGKCCRAESERLIAAIFGLVVLAFTVGDMDIGRRAGNASTSTALQTSLLRPRDRHLF